MIESHREAFIEEACDLLRELETALLELEEDPANPETVGRVFRALHTLKGSGGMFGFDALSRFTHELETVFDQVRDGRYPVTAELIGITLDARDHIQNLLDRAAPAGELAEASNRLLARLRKAVPSSSAPSPSPGEAAKPETPGPGPEPAAGSRSEQGDPHTFRIRFDPHRDILLTGTNPILLFGELGQLGELGLTANLGRIPPLADFNPDECYTHWDAVLTTVAGENEIRDVFIFVEDRALLEVQSIGRAGRVETATPEQQHVERIVSPLTSRDKAQRAEAAATVRVPAAKLDALVNIVSELVTVQARLSAYAQTSGESEINFIAEEAGRLTGLLRESTMSTRMLPIGEAFSRFKRLVRDLSADLGKKVELTTEGNDTELDKTVIEQLNDPLVHLIRNAIGHGIELPADRVAQGKSEVGRVHLSACHSGAFVLIRVSDDGAGMNRDAIRARAVERGMISAAAVLGDEEIFALTVAAGFSTADHVTAVSGRGVGMDVVERSLNLLHGTLAISSQPGKGTVITLRIPLTLAIIDGLLVEVAGSFFVVPLANISECLEMERSADGATRHSLINVRGELVPYIRLRQRFALAGAAPPIEHVIVTETQGGKYGFVVDRVIGDHNTVIKKLGRLYRHVEEVSGATILGNGDVALVLDVDKMAAEALREESLQTCER